MISVAQDSGGAKAVDKWFDRASPTFRCVIDTTHQISSLFGWVNLPCAAWIDEQGRVVRSNEGVLPAEMGVNLGVVKLIAGDSSFSDATRDWIEHGAASEHVLSSAKLAEQTKPVTDETLLAEAEFKLALHFEAQGDKGRARRHFATASELAPDNWLYLRQGWTASRSRAYSDLKSYRRMSRLNKNTDKVFSDRTGLPGENYRRFTLPEWFWTPMLQRFKQRRRR